MDEARQDAVKALKMIEAFIDTQQKLMVDLSSIICDLDDARWKYRLYNIEVRGIQKKFKAEGDLRRPMLSVRTAGLEERTMSQVNELRKILREENTKFSILRRVREDLEELAES